MTCRALELCQQVLGPQHPNTIDSISNLAACLHSQVCLGGRTVPFGVRAGNVWVWVCM